MYSQDPDGRMRETGSPSVLFGVAAAFSASTPDFSEGILDANRYLIRHRAASFYFNVAGDSMRDAGVLDGDKVLVDRSVAARHGHIVVAVINGEYLLRRLVRQRDVVELRAEHPAYKPIRLRAGEALQVWGVVVGVVRKLAV